MTKLVYNAFSVVDRIVKDRKGEPENDTTWRQIGVAFDHKDGQGLDVVLDALPTNGRIVLRTPKAKGEGSET